MKHLNIPTAALVPSHTAFQTQRRAERTDEQRESMAKSVTEMGIIQPLIVRELIDFTPTANDPLTAHLEEWQSTFYEIIAGEGRIDGAIAAQLDDCPCIIKDLTDAQALEIQLLENLQRDSVSPLAEATGYTELRDVLGRSLDEIAAIFDRTENHVRQTIKLTQLTTAEKTALLHLRITRNVAYALTAITDPQQRLYLFDRVSEEGISQTIGLGLIKQSKEVELARQAWETQIPAAEAYYPRAEVILDFTESLKNFDADSKTTRFDSPYRLFDETIPDGAIRRTELEIGTTWGALSDLLDHKPLVIRNGKGSAVQVTKGLEHLAQIKARQGAAEDYETHTKHNPSTTPAPDPDFPSEPAGHHLPDTYAAPESIAPAANPHHFSPDDFAVQWLSQYNQHAEKLSISHYREIIAQMVPPDWIEAVQLAESHNEITWTLIGVHLETLGNQSPEKQTALLAKLIN